jgi:hypothetical protein
MLRLAGLAATVAAVAFSVAGSGTAATAAVSCGTPITTSVTLTADLNCSGDGIVFEGTADQRAPITIDLNGHTIRGSGVGVGIALDGMATVRNGTVSGFDVGVVVSGWPDTFSRLWITHNTDVGFFDEEDTATVTVTDSVVAENGGDGISATNSRAFMDLRVSHTRIANNRGDGLRFGFTDGWNISQSTIVGNRGDGLFSDTSSGLISNTVASHNGGSGVVISDGTQAAVAFNRVTNVTAEGNGIWGIALDVDPSAAPFYDGGGNRANHNGQPTQCFQIACSP